MGNPRKIASEFTEGFNDLVEKPLDNFGTTNALGVGTGLIEGTGSLAKHTAGATTGAISRVTKSLADVAGFVHGDHKYNQSRMQLRFEKANTFGETMAKSARQLGGGIFNGITGLYTQPAEMQEVEGVKGIIKGGVFGVAGLFTKPISGMLDAVSTVTGGVQKSTRDERNFENEERLREPRAFYGNSRSIL